MNCRDILLYMPDMNSAAFFCDIRKTVRMICCMEVFFPLFNGDTFIITIFLKLINHLNNDRINAVIFCGR